MLTALVLLLALASAATASEHAGVTTANGWYEAEEIYCVDHGAEEEVTAQGENDTYLIGGDHAFQVQVVVLCEMNPANRPDRETGLAIPVRT